VLELFPILLKRVKVLGNIKKNNFRIFFITRADTKANEIKTFFNDQHSVWVAKMQISLFCITQQISN